MNTPIYKKMTASKASKINWTTSNISKTQQKAKKDSKIKSQQTNK